MNIHYLDFLLNNFFVQGRVIDYENLSVMTFDNTWFEFGYDQSKLQNKRYLLAGATFKLKKIDALGAAYAKGRRDETIRHRMRRYPKSNTCGSFFRNFYDEEAPIINGKKMPYIAYFLDKIGIKGELRVGNAIVSYQHANMIVTLPEARSQDVVDLVCREQKMVLDQFGVLPNPECQLVGFKKYPFLKN
jgi:UDP-N-acetylmuramate dehydrogenase